MWNMITERLMLSFLEILCIVLAFLIPFGVYKINQAFHHNMDPPWKEKEKG